MKIKLISDEVKKNIEGKVLDLLNGKIDSLEIDACPPNLIVDYLGKLGVDIDLGDDMETNGWDWDYWIRFKYKHKHYIISGSGYYGNLKVILDTDYKEEDDEEENNDNLTAEEITDLLNQVNNVLGNVVNNK